MKLNLEEWNNIEEREEIFYKIKNSKENLGK